MRVTRASAPIGRPKALCSLTYAREKQPHETVGPREMIAAKLSS